MPKQEQAASPVSHSLVLKLEIMIACMHATWLQNHNRLMTYHEQGCHNPVKNDAEPNLDPYLAMCKYEVKSLILDFAQYRIHHDKQAHSYYMSAGRSSPIHEDAPYR
jgi:hypothetical protein